MTPGGLLSLFPPPKYYFKSYKIFLKTIANHKKFEITLKSINKSRKKTLPCWLEKFRPPI